MKGNLSSSAALRQTALTLIPASSEERSVSRHTFLAVLLSSLEERFRVLSILLPGVDAWWACFTGSLLAAGIVCSFVGLLFAGFVAVGGGLAGSLLCCCKRTTVTRLCYHSSNLKTTSSSITCLGDGHVVYCK